MGKIANQIYSARYEYFEDAGHYPEAAILSEDVYNQLKKECDNFLVSDAAKNVPETIFGMRIKVVETSKGEVYP